MNHIFRLSTLFLVLMLLGACKQETATEETIRPVFYQRADALVLSENTNLPGLVAYQKESKLSFKSGGVITKIAVKEGQRVSRGAFLASVDNTDYQVKVEQSVASKEATLANQKAAEAQVEKAQANLSTTKANFLRIEQLYLKNHVSLAEYEQAKSQYDNAKSAVHTAQAQYKAAISKTAASDAQLDASQNQLNYTRLTAPTDGVVSQLFVEENEMIAAGMPVMVISSNRDLMVQSVVPESWINQIEVGDEVAIYWNAKKQQIQGRILEITPKTPANTGYPIKIALPNAPTDLQAGMSVKVVIQKASEEKAASQSLIVHTEAVAKDANGHFVYVLQASKGDYYIAKKQMVEVGELTQHGYTIMEGLRNSDIVATAGIRFLADGMKVRLQEPIE